MGVGVLLCNSAQAQSTLYQSGTSGSTTVVVNPRSRELPAAGFRLLQAGSYRVSEPVDIACAASGHMITAVLEKGNSTAKYFDSGTKRWGKLGIDHRSAARATPGGHSPYRFTNILTDGQGGVYAGVTFYKWGLSIPSVCYWRKGVPTQCLIRPQHFVDSGKRTRSKPFFHMSTGPKGQLWCVSGLRSAKPYSGRQVDIVRGYWQGGKFLGQPVSIRFQGYTPPAYSLFQGCTDWEGGYIFYTGLALWRLTPDGIARPLVNVKVAGQGASYGNPVVDGNGDIWIPVARKFKSVAYVDDTHRTDVYSILGDRSRLVRVRLTARGAQVHEISTSRFLSSLGRSGVMKVYTLKPDWKYGGIVGYDSHQDVAFHLKSTD